MTPARWEEIKTVLDQVLQSPPDDQSARLDALCGEDADLRAEVEALLQAEANAPAFLDADAGTLGAQLFDDPTPEETIGPTAQIGAYELVEQIGSGGMGVVYRAERADGHFEQEVALKVLPRYFETEERMARFRAERQILASLSHPHIARLLDGGVTSAGHPYLVMEYVEGIPITEYCTQQDISLHDRIRLLQTVGRAVHHAHSNLVVHRDLKPSNILVTENGTVKLLDFGIAKLLNPESVPSPPPTTGAGKVLMTPEYAAPEQVRGEDVTTATDVYQLGVLAYELLAGTRPYQFDRRRLPEIERVLLKTRPTRPSEAVLDPEANNADRLAEPASTWSRQLEGDLDEVVMKALRKNPDVRYASAKAVADDLGRVLSNRPVRAKPVTVGYRFRKFIQRNRRSTLMGLIGVLLIASVSVVYTIQIQNERDRARAEARKSDEVSSFLMDLFEANAPTETLGDTITARTLLDRGLERADALQKQPGVQAQMFDVVGQIYGRLGNYERADSVLREAVEIRSREHGSEAPEAVETREHLGVLLGDAGKYDAAERILRDVLDTRETILNQDAPTLAQTKRRLAYVLRRQGTYEEARTLLEESLPVVISHFGEQSEQALSTRSSLGVVLQNLGDYRGTESHYRSVLEERRRQLEPPHPKLAMSANNLATLLMNIGEFEEAESLFREALTMRKTLFGPNHPKVALTLNNLALVHREQERYDAAEPLFRRGLSIRRSQLGEEHLSVAISLFGLGGLLNRTDRPQEALDAYEQALGLFEQHLGSEHSFVARTRMGIGHAHQRLENQKQAANALHEGFDQVRRIHDESSLEFAIEAGRLGQYHLSQGHTARAKSLLEKSLTTLQSIETSTTPRQRNVRQSLLELSDDSTASPFPVDRTSS